MSFSLGSLTVKIGADLTGLNDALREASTAMNKAGKQLSKIGATMTASITAPIVAAGTAAFNLHKGFESSMAKINGLVGVSKKQVGEWSDDIIKLAPQLGKAPKELADGLFFVTSAGIKGAAAMDVLTQSAKASAAGLGEVDTIADLVTSAMNAYGQENLSASEATDVLVASVREGKAEAPALAAALGQVLPIASEMGVSFDQVGASVAAMTRTGTEATTASMQLKNILASLLKPTDQAAAALETMGTSAGDMRKMIREDGLIATLGHLRKLTNQYGEEAMANVFPNIRALSGVLDLMGSNAESNIAIFDSLTDSTGSLDKAFASAAETAQFKWDQAVSGVKTTMTSFGQAIATAILPLMQKFTLVLQNVTAWFTSLSEAQQQSVIKWVAIAAAIGPVLLIIGKVVTVVSMLGPLFAALTSPIGLVVAAIAALAAGILYVWDNWAAIKERISDISWWRNALIDMVQFFIENNAFSLMIEGYNALVSKLGGDEIPNPFDKLSESLEQFKVETKEYENEFGSFTDALKNGMQKVTGLFTGGGGGGGEKAGPSLEDIIPTDEQISKIGGVASAYTAVGEAVATTQEAANTGEGNLIDSLTPSSEQVEQLVLFKDAMARMSEGITQSLNEAVVNTAVGIGEMIGNFAVGAKGLTSLGALVKGIGSTVLQSLGDLATQVGKMAIATGIAVLGIKKALESLNPFVAIAAGIALVAVGAAVSSKAKSLAGGMGGKESGGSLQGLATGGTVTSSGAFMVGEKGPELVNLPAGAAVTPNHMLGQGAMQGQLTTRISGRDLEIVLNQWNEDKNRIG